MSLHATTSQTVGPYLHIGMTWLVTENLASRNVPGERIAIEGRVLDGDGKPVNDASVEIWQADAKGKYGAKGFRGFGRSNTDAKGRFRFKTIKPGRVPGRDGTLQAPHIAVNIFMRGQLKQLVTRIYFEGEKANEIDPVLARIEDPARRQTLVAKRTANGYRFDIRIQGEGETVFFDM